MTYAFEPDAEPKENTDSDENDELRGGTVELRHWDPANRTSWMRTAGADSNVDAEGILKQREPDMFPDLINPVDPPVPYDTYWQDHVNTCKMSTWDTLQDQTAKYTDESLSRDTLGDDHQQLFVTLVLDHVQHVIDSLLTNS